MGIYNSVGKPYFQAGQFGQPMTVSLQPGQILVPIQGYAQQQNALHNHAAAMGQQQGISSGIAMGMMAAQQTAANYYAAMGQANKLIDFWTNSKYTKDECEMAIGQKAVMFNSANIHIKKINLNNIVSDKDLHYYPSDIIKIPFIDKLRLTKLYKMVK